MRPTPRPEPIGWLSHQAVSMLINSSSPELASEGAVVLWGLMTLAAVVAGLIFALLTYASTKGDWPRTMIAALGVTGAVLVGLHQMLLG